MSIIFNINFHTISRYFAPSEKYPAASISSCNPPKISNTFDIWSLPKTDYSSTGKCQTCFFYNIFLYISKKNLVVSKRGAIHCAAKYSLLVKVWQECQYGSGEFFSAQHPKSQNLASSLGFLHDMSLALVTFTGFNHLCFDFHIDPNIQYLLRVVCRLMCVFRGGKWLVSVLIHKRWNIWHFFVLFCFEYFIFSF